MWLAHHCEEVLNLIRESKFLPWKHNFRTYLWGISSNQRNPSFFLLSWYTRRMNDLQCLYSFAKNHGKVSCICISSTCIAYHLPKTKTYTIFYPLSSNADYSTPVRDTPQLQDDTRSAWSQPSFNEDRHWLHAGKDGSLAGNHVTLGPKGEGCWD